MKNLTKGSILVLAVFFSLVAWWVASPWLAWRRDYGVAERLVKVIWPMAAEMVRFSEERGQSPNSLEEIARFSPDHDFSVLQRYPHEFSATGSRRFFLRVNTRFAFVIDEQFRPNWFQPTRVGGTTTNPK